MFWMCTTLRFFSLHTQETIDAFNLVKFTVRAHNAAKDIISESIGERNNIVHGNCERNRNLERNRWTFAVILSNAKKFALGQEIIAQWQPHTTTEPKPINPRNRMVGDLMCPHTCASTQDMLTLVVVEAKVIMSGCRDGPAHRACNVSHNNLRFCQPQRLKDDRKP